MDGTTTEQRFRLPEKARAALADAESIWRATYGTASRDELRAAYVRALEGACHGGAPAGRFAAARAQVERAHREAYGVARLAAEAADERARDAAVASDEALVAYEAKWGARLTRLQRRYPHRWRVPGLSEEEVRDELTLRLLDAVRTSVEERARHHRAGREWGLMFLADQRRAMRKSYRLEIVVADVAPVVDRGMTEEERLLAEEGESLFARARANAERGLNGPQRRWLSAMKMTANAGQFFAASGKLNLAAASRLLDKDRSAGQRAFGALQERFARELRKLGG